MVKRTYTTGISFDHYPRGERREKRYKLAKIIEQLSEENYQLCRKHNKEVINYVLENKIQYQSIADLLPEITMGKGKFGVNELMTHIGLANNHLHSGFHLMFNSAKGFINRISKFQAILGWFKTEPLELVKWVLWQRSTYQIHVFQKRWGDKFSLP